MANTLVVAQMGLRNLSKVQPQASTSHFVNQSTWHLRTVAGLTMGNVEYYARPLGIIY